MAREELKEAGYSISSAMGIHSDSGNVYMGDLQLVHVTNPAGVDEFYAAPLPPEYAERLGWWAHAGSNVAAQRPGAGGVQGEIHTVQAEEIAKLKAELGAKHAENKKLRKWNEHLENKMLKYMDLAFDQLSGGKSG